MINSATLLGSSSGRNAGDAALISGIMGSVDAACGRKLTYEIPTINTKFIRENYTAHKVVPISMMPWNLSIKMLGLPTYQSVMRTDVSLIFDAILFDRSLYNPLFNFLSTLYLILPRAKRQGKLIGLYNVGAGPVSTPQGRKMLKTVAEIADFITVRDPGSFKLLRDIGVQNPRMILTADAALNAPASDERRSKEIMRGLGLNPEEETFAVNVNAYLDTWASPGRVSMGREKFVTAYRAALQRVSQELGVQMLFVSTQHHDVDITREIMAGISSSKPMAMLPNTTYSHYDVKGVLGHVSLLFGMRLHAMILASSMLTPIVGLAYQPKCDYYYESLGLESFSMSFDDFSEDGLVRHMLSGWEKRTAIRSTLEERIPQLKSDADKAGQVVAAVARGETIESALSRLASEDGGARASRAG